MTPAAIQTFIARWTISGGAERANYALFLSELCDLLEVPRPEPTQGEDDANAYVFERRVVFINPDASQSFGRIDLYKRGSFVLETKQGIEKQDEETLLSEAASQRRRRRLRGHGTRGSSAWNAPAFHSRLDSFSTRDLDETPARRTTREIHWPKSSANWCSQSLRIR